MGGKVKDKNPAKKIKNLKSKGRQKKMDHWNFDISLGGSRRSDGVYFRVSSNYSHQIWNESMLDWVWIVHWPNPAQPSIWLNPVKRNLQTPVDVQNYIDQKWPINNLNSKDSQK